MASGLLGVEPVGRIYTGGGRGVSTWSRLYPQLTVRPWPSPFPLLPLFLSMSNGGLAKYSLIPTISPTKGEILYLHFIEGKPGLERLAGPPRLEREQGRVCTWGRLRGLRSDGLIAKATLSDDIQPIPRAIWKRHLWHCSPPGRLGGAPVPRAQAQEEAALFRCPQHPTQGWGSRLGAQEREVLESLNSKPQ